MFINHLFDMTEVEQVICDDDTHVTKENGNLLTNIMPEITESYIDSVIGIAVAQDIINDELPTEQKSPSTEHSGYSMLADAFSADIENATDVALCVDNEVIIAAENITCSAEAVVEITEVDTL
jgi:uncharacterized protein (UPF0276 family)